MRRVERTPFTKSFRSGLVGPTVDAPFLIRARHVFNPTALTILLWLVTFFTSPFSRHSAILWISMSIYVAISFWSLHGKAHSLILRRRMPATGRFYEGDEVDVGFEVHNAGLDAFDGDVEFEDFFGPSVDEDVRESTRIRVRPKSKTSFEIRRTCDGEMGAKKIGPMSMRIRDGLGLFEFTIYEDEVVETELLPRIRAIKPLPVHGSRSSHQYGLYEIPSRGISVNFIGIRPYVRGDALRHIAWKITSKHRDLMVKEFEKVVNSEITIVLNLDPRLHFGSEAGSTWDHAKHLALASARQQLELGNSVQVISNGYYLPPARDVDHAEVLARGLASLQPTARAEKSRHILDEASNQIRSESTVIYVTVFEQEAALKDYDAIARLRDRGVDVIVSIVDASSFLMDSPTTRAYLGYLGKRKPIELDEFAIRLRVAGASVRVATKREFNAMRAS